MASTVNDNIRIDEILPGQYALRIDSRVGLVMPWYTHGALEALVAMDFRGKQVLEWGGGCSSFWWASQCAHVLTLESDESWASWIATTARKRCFENIVVEYRWPIDQYLAVPKGFRPDVVCVDGAVRTECIEKALAFERPLLLIVDNLQQDDVYVCKRAEQLMAPFRGDFYVQADHTAHRGRPWQTAIWRLE